MSPRMSFNNLRADLSSHRIEGYAAHGGERIDIELISHIDGNLYMGGCLNKAPLGDFFHAVFSLYPWERYTLWPTVERTEVKMYDAHGTPDMDAASSLAKKVVAALDHGPVLVHCQAGLNRSGLITALALMHMGRTADEAIRLLRDRRSPTVLCNRSFEQALRDFTFGDEIEGSA